MRVAADDYRGVGPADAVDGDDLIEFRRQPIGQRSWRSVAEQDERVVDPQAALPGQVTQIVHSLVAELIPRPLRRDEVRIGRALGEPRERGGEVAVGHGQIGVTADDEGAGPLQLADQINGPGGVRAVEGEVAADRHVVGARRVDGLADLLEGGQIAVDV